MEILGGFFLTSFRGTYVYGSDQLMSYQLGYSDQCTHVA